MRIISNDMTEAEIRTEIDRIGSLPPTELTLELAQYCSSLRNALQIMSNARKPLPVLIDN